MRDYVTFTDKRIISVNVQGITGKKKDFSSLPYAKIQVFSVETSGVFDLDSELELYFSGLGKVKFEFVFPLMLNFVLIGILAFVVIHFWCPNLSLGLGLYVRGLFLNAIEEVFCRNKNKSKIGEKEKA